MSEIKNIRDQFISKLKNDNIPIITEPAAPITSGLKFLDIFIYIFF